MTKLDWERARRADNARAPRKPIKRHPGRNIPRASRTLSKERMQAREMRRLKMGLPVTDHDHSLLARAKTIGQRKKVKARFKARYRKRKATLDAKRAASRRLERRSSKVIEGILRAARKRERSYKGHLADLAEVVSPLMIGKFQTESGTFVKGAPLSAIERHLETIGRQTKDLYEEKSLERQLRDAGFKYVAVRKNDFKFMVFTP